jgi:hypothetical protein
MIGTRTDEPPSEWTNMDIAELIDHANELSANGNPAGFFVSRGLRKVQPTFPVWDEEYVACRAWIEENRELVRTAWQYVVRSDP